MNMVPGGFESDFSDEDELIQFSKNIAKKKQNISSPVAVSEVVKIELPDEPIIEKPKINWTDIGTKKDSANANGYYLNELKPGEKNSSGTVNLFEENLKRLLLAEDVKGMGFLMEDDFDINFCFSSRLSLLSFVAYHHKKHMLSFLLENGAKTYVEDSISPIIALCSRKCITKTQALDSITILELLMKFKIDINTLSKDQQNSLHFCIKNGNGHLCQELIKYNIDIHAQDRANITPLCLASKSGEKAIVVLLLSLFSHSPSHLSEIRCAIKLCTSYPIETILQNFIDNPDTIPIIPKNLELTDSYFENDKENGSNRNDSLCNLLNGIGMKHLVSHFTKKSIHFNDVIRMSPEFLSNRMQLSDEEVNRLKNIINEIILNSYDKNSMFLGNKNSFSIIDICISLHKIIDLINFLNSSTRNLFEKVQIIDTSQCPILKEAFDHSCVQLYSSNFEFTETVQDLVNLKEKSLNKNKNQVQSVNSDGNCIKINSILGVGLVIITIVVMTVKLRTWS